MSRRSSATSLTTTASGSTTVDDPLMRDCYDLRRRLLQTEQSIKELNPPFINGSGMTHGNATSNTSLNKLSPLLSDRQTNLYFAKALSEPSDHAPVLTLADLSPATSDTNFEFHDHQYNPSYQLRPSSSGHGEETHQQYDGDKREIDQCSIGSGDDYGSESLRTKLSTLREKNTLLVSQNHKLMSELENMGYDLHQERSNVKGLTVDLQKEQESVHDYEDRVIALEKEISSQHVSIKSSEEKLFQTKQELQEKADEINNISLSSQDCQLKYQDELKLRQQLQSQLEETLVNVEQITSKISQDKEREKQQSKLTYERLESMDRELNELTNERNELLSQNTVLEGHVIELKEEIRLLQSEGIENEEYKSSLERDNVNLRSTVARQSQRVGQLEKQSPQNENSTRLLELVKIQNEKIHYYQQEIEQSKVDMLRLETLVQEVQKQSVRRDVYHNSLSVVDSSTSHSTGVADGGGGTMTGLRSELSFVAERNKMNDRKQLELEQIILRMEDEAASYSSQLIQLEEKVAEKSAMNVSLESKVNQQNLRVVDIQSNMEEVRNNNNELQCEIQKKRLDIENLEKELEEKMVDLGSYVSQLEDVEETIENKKNYINELEESLREKDEEVVEHQNLLEKTRSLHSEHCKELERQIEQLQKEYEGKNNQVSQLETVLKACRQDVVMKTARSQEMEKTLSEQKRELEHRKKQSTEYETKLEKLQEKARIEGERGVELDEALKQCQQGMQVYIEQLKVANDNHEETFQQKISEIKQLKGVLEKCKGDYHKRCKENEQMEQMLIEKNEMLKEHQRGMSELENSQKRLKQQVGILELELGQEREKNREEVKKLQCLLENAREGLDERTKQLNELNTSLVEVHKDMKQSSSHVVDLEQLLQLTRERLEKKCEETNDVSNSLKQTETTLTEYSEKNEKMCTTLMETEKKLCDKEEQIVKLDGELTKTQQEVQQTLHQLKELKNVLEDNKKELKEREEKLNELDKELNESQELLQKKNIQLDEKDARVSELDQTMRGYQLELKQRVCEMNKLDVTMKEQRSDLRQKANVLEHSLSQYQHELSEKTLEISELKAKYAQSQEQVKQKSIRLEYMEKTMKQQQQELRKRMDQVTEFEKEFKQLKLDSDDNSQVSQELCLAREQVQNMHSELLDTRRKLLQCERKEQKFLEELEEAHGLLTGKEEDCARLAKELGSSQVREAQAEARCVQEVRRTEQQCSLKVGNYESELHSLRENHSKLFSQKEEEDATHRLKIQKLREKEKNNDKEIKHLKDEHTTLNEYLTHLKEQLNKLQEQTYAANEAVVIKESQIARLQAKVSGYERATFGSRLHFGPSDSIPSPSYSKSCSRSPSQRGAGTPSYFNYQSKAAKVKRSNSAHDLHNMSTNLVSFSSETSYDNGTEKRVLSDTGSKYEENTFERLFDEARQELDSQKKTTETWTSLRGVYNENNGSLNDDEEDNIQ